ncbi:MAG: type II secretion system F family protein [Candidatus Nanoarchaeia archaeon]|nr:type II secretion system F family protein [Candidatus Nanoarchaeia archaeon]
MTYESLKENVKRMQEIIGESSEFTNQLNLINNSEFPGESMVSDKEKKLLEETIVALTNQFTILNNSIPSLLEGISFYKKLESSETKQTPEPKQKLLQVSYKPPQKDTKISFTITDAEKKEFLENLSKSNLSISKLKKKYSSVKEEEFLSRANPYAKMSNRFFKKISNNLIAKGYFEKLNKSLRKINSNFVLGTYLSMILFTTFLSFLASILIFIFLLFFKVSLTIPFVSIVEEPFIFRFIKTFWIIFVVPIAMGILVYLYPTSEAKNLGTKIDRELPFVTIHMAAIATSGIEPTNIFKIILRNEEYKYSNAQIKKLMNLINFHGEDLVTALKKVSAASPSSKLRELLDGMATAITSGGSLYQFLDKHAESLLFDYRLERERYTKASETFMDIYISVVIAAPMILLILFVIIGSTGMLINFLGLSTGTLSILIILIIVLLNIGFLAFLRMQQPEL